MGFETRYPFFTALLPRKNQILTYHYLSRFSLC